VQVVNVTKARGSIIVANKVSARLVPPPIGAMFAYLRARRPRLAAFSRASIHELRSDGENHFLRSDYAECRNISKLCHRGRTVTRGDSEIPLPHQSIPSRDLREGNATDNEMQGKCKGRTGQRRGDARSIVFHILSDRRDGKRQSLIFMYGLIRVQFNFGRFSSKSEPINHSRTVSIPRFYTGFRAKTRGSARLFGWREARISQGRR